MHSIEKSVGQALDLMPTMQESLEERIAYQLKNARDRVARLEELTQLLRENPQFARMMTLMQNGL